jgi:protein-L-isoaspartate(D-aspartate) O-methyltransferase
MDFFVARQNMVESQVRVNDVTDAALQKAMRSIARERLVAPGQGFAAYGEVEVVMAPGRVLMKPRDIAKLLNALKPSSGELALAIAAPYAAAVLQHAGLKVVAQDNDARIDTVASPYLSELGVKVVTQDLNQPFEGEFDIVIIEGAVEAVPEAWFKALKIGGRLGVVVRHKAFGRANIYTKLSSGISKFEAFDSLPTLLQGFVKTPGFVF